jgi:hypothetical protein
MHCFSMGCIFYLLWESDCFLLETKGHDDVSLLTFGPNRTRDYTFQMSLQFLWLTLEVNWLGFRRKPWLNNSI